MIAIFPEPYPDELLYSILARYYVRSGHTMIKHCFEELYPTKTRPDIEYLNPMTPDLLSHLGNIDQLVLQHTMFPALRFIPAEKRKAVFQELTQQDMGYQDHVFKPKERRYLRFCPLCVAEDRAIYGETYWHRFPQIRGMHVCPKHGCKLIDSKILIYSKEAGTLLPAEAIIPEDSPIIFAGTMEKRASAYAASIFYSTIIDSDNYIGEFLRSNTIQYRTPGGKSIRSTRLFEEFKAAFPDTTITEEWQIRKIFNGKRFDFLEVCNIAFFLGINAQNLLEQHDCKQNAPKINNGKYRSYKKDWNKVDLAYLPHIETAISSIAKSEPPIRFTRGLISRKAGISYSTLTRGNLPLCASMIDKYLESQEEYWARKLEWAYCAIAKRKSVIYKTDLRKATNIEFSDMKRSIPYLKTNELIQII